MKDVNFWRIILLTKHLIRVSPAERYNSQGLLKSNSGDSECKYSSLSFFLGAPVGFPSPLSFLLLNPKTLCGPVVYFFFPSFPFFFLSFPHVDG